MEHRVAGGAGWRVCIAKFEASGGEVEHLMAPRVPELGEAVDEENIWALLDFSNVLVDTIGFG